MLILGINAFHGDASACLVQNGKVLVAIEEERLCRKKHVAGFPSLAIKRCLNYAGLNGSQIRYISIAKDPSANFAGKFKRAASLAITAPNQLFANLQRLKQASTETKARVAMALGVQKDDLATSEVVAVEHHLAHIASAYYYGLSPEPAVGISIDGMGDSISTLVTRCQGSSIERLTAVGYPNSLGFFYTALTQFLGFNQYGDEYKMMGLAASGKPTRMEEIGELLYLTDDGGFKLNLQYFLHSQHRVEMTWDEGTPQLSRLYSDQLSKLLGSPRQPAQAISRLHRDIACSAQAIYAKAMHHILAKAQLQTGLTTLALAGGCAQNSLANGHVPAEAGYKKVFIPPSSHDGGTALGAAIYTSLQKGQGFVTDLSPYLGSTIEVDEVQQQMLANDLTAKQMSMDALIATVINCICNCGVVGWVQGRAEWGPRALGNRSILADPRNPAIRTLLNSKIKRRESFRPFAPSVVAALAHQWFVLDSCNAQIPYMEKVVVVHPEKRVRIPAVVHDDGTARVQLVSESINPLYHQLLLAMYKTTGIPMLLNTSFNENEPMVESAENAIACFSRTRMDILVIGNLLLSR